MKRLINELSSLLAMDKLNKDLMKDLIHSNTPETLFRTYPKKKKEYLVI